MLDGPYQLLWSRTPITDDTEYVLLAEGEVERGGTQVEITFTIPEAVYGLNYVQFRRQYRPEEPINLIFNVTPSVTVSPSSVSPGTKVTVTGTGFTDEDVIELSFDGEDTGMDVITNEVGTFTAKLTIPDVIAGAHTFQVLAESLYNVKGEVNLEVVPGITLAPELPEIDDEATVTGRGFAASSEITIEYDDITVASSSGNGSNGSDEDNPLSTDATGKFSHVFKIPESSEVEHEITAIDEAGNKATLSLSLEGNPPSAPAPTLPEGQRYGWFGSQEVEFIWQEVSDPSGVTYTLEVGDNLNFFPLAPGMRRLELTEPRCRLNLEPGNYYWRVKAIDGAGNEGEWAISPYQFRVGFFTVWHVVIGVLIFISAFVLLIRAFFRRIREYYH